MPTAFRSSFLTTLRSPEPTPRQDTHTRSSSVRPTAMNRARLLKVSDTPMPSSPLSEPALSSTAEATTPLSAPLISLLKNTLPEARLSSPAISSLPIPLNMRSPASPLTALLFRITLSFTAQATLTTQRPSPSALVRSPASASPWQAIKLR